MKPRRLNKHILRTDVDNRDEEDDFPDVIPEIKPQASTDVDGD